MGDRPPAAPAPASAAGRRREVPPRAERGAGSALVLGIVAALVVLTAAAIPLLGALIVHQRVVRAADSAALAAADTLSGRVTGYPCENAERMAGLARTRLDDCRLDELIARAQVSAEYLGMHLAAVARAGPPGSR